LVSFTPQPLLPQGKSPLSFEWAADWAEETVWSGQCEEQKISIPSREAVVQLSIIEPGHYHLRWAQFVQEL
jgi:hypothetical protein